ncbi:NAD-dependent deacylase [Mucilaginibacter gynuensis]|uniref:NAD-dependent protein deacylase n=1 Tax=Mucilaginibacter gynuensis TaxID=1302236 RepID=A0ABP8FQP1_9SPHI
MKNIVILTGAGISAESGLKTFRDSDGLWEGYNIQDVATPEAWDWNPVMVQDFYNERRKSVLAALPNAAHYALARLEEKYKVTIITQNIDDLHQRAGSTNVVHLHGIITRSQSSIDSKLTYPIDGWELKMGELCELGSQLRAHVVWFGEDVPMIEEAAKICTAADIFILIGTSLAVYPAAGLINYVPKDVAKIIVDPKIPGVGHLKNVVQIEKNATVGVPLLVDQLLGVDPLNSV